MTTNEQLLQELREVHGAFTGYVASLGEAAYCHARPGRWTAGQHLGHILISVTAMNRGLQNSKFQQPSKDVISDRSPMELAGLQAFYRQKAGNGVTAPPSFAPGEAPWVDRGQVFVAVEKAVDELGLHITHFADGQLDGLALPHPLLGWLSLREMMYFTIFHCVHHFEIATKEVETMPL